MSDKKKKIMISIAIMSLSIIAFMTSGEKRELIDDGVIDISEDEYVDIDIETEDFIISNYGIKLTKSDITEDEFENEVDAYYDRMIEKMLGDNKSTQEVTKSLNLFTKYEELPYEILWFVNDREYIGDSGEILCAEAFDTVIDLFVCYKSYSLDYSIPIHVEPCAEEIARVEEELLKNQLVSVLDENTNAVINSAESPKLKLPDNVNGKRVKYYKSGEDKKYTYLLLGPIGVVAILLAFKKDEKKKQDDRVDKIMSEYPSVLQKISLYVSSGMTIRNIWSKICDEAKGKEVEGHPLIQEMTITQNELNNGVPESMAYIRFGERIKKSEIVRFTALLSQNLKKGSTKLSDLLDNEARNAFVDKKNRARKQGEEMGTKLMFPMMILLTDTLVMIMVPAFWSL